MAFVGDGSSYDVAFIDISVIVGLDVDELLRFRSRDERDLGQMVSVRCGMNSLPSFIADKAVFPDIPQCEVLKGFVPFVPRTEFDSSHDHLQKKNPWATRRFHHRSNPAWQRETSDPRTLGSTVTRFSRLVSPTLQTLLSRALKVKRELRTRGRRSVIRHKLVLRLMAGDVQTQHLGAVKALRTVGTWPTRVTVPVFGFHDPSLTRPVSRSKSITSLILARTATVGSPSNSSACRSAWRCSLQTAPIPMATLSAALMGRPQTKHLTVALRWL